MNHKLRVLVRVDIDPAQVTIEVSGCVTHSDSAALLHIMRRAGRVATGSDVVVDLHGASHLDPEVLLDLRHMAAAGIRPCADPDGQATGDGHIRLTLHEPAALPICLLHVGADGEVLAGLEPEGIQTGPGGALVPAVSGSDTWPDAGADGALSLHPDGGPGLPAEGDGLEGLDLSEYFEGTLDPAATVRALSDAALGRLADALYSHLDTARPLFGAHTWYELAAEEIQARHLYDAAPPSAQQGTGVELAPEALL